MNAYRFKLTFSPHERPTPNLQGWIESLTGQQVTLHKWPLVSSWWHRDQGCEVHLQATRSDALAFYNLMLQHHRIESIQTI